jgi:predicted TIM-barrel fold metal-dependent hydrolase
MARKIIDLHTYLGISSTLQVGGSAENVLRILDNNGIDQAIISPIPGYEDPNGVQDSVAQNDNIAAALKRWPDRFPRGFGVVEPRHGKAALPEVDRILGELGLVGLMFHNDFNGMTLDSPAMFNILERASRHKNVIIQAHVTHMTVLEPHFMLGKLAKAFPEITFIAAHPFMDMTALQAAIELGRNHPNIYFDTCISLHHLSPMEKAVAGIGEDRIMFGSDCPYFEFCFDIGKIEHAVLSDEVKNKIFSGNAARLFGLED